MHHPLNGVAALPHLGVIRVEGEEAAKFLQGQLTQDFALLTPAQARLAAFCNAKGRMLASFVGLQHGDDGILLVCSRDILAPALKRLSMFVLRAKARLSDATADYALSGLAGEALEAAGADLTGPWSKLALGRASLVELYPADGQRRALWIAAAGEPPPAGTALSTELWSWGDVRSGVATITAPIVEAFVPQMLNYESVGGVNFKKGCYPGQEVVARSQFRGTLKRRAGLAHAPEPMAAGQEIFHSSDPTQPCGLVAQAAARPGSGWDAIASLQTSATQDGTLSLGGPGGPALALLPLPYLLMLDL